jgi:hypothetical protein
MATTPAGVWKIGTLALVKNGTIVPTAEYGYNFDRAIEIIHSVHEERVGAVIGPGEITFTIRMYDMRKTRAKNEGESVSRKFLQEMLDKESFDCHISYRDANTGVWSFNKVSFKDCFVSSFNSAGFNGRGAPMIDLQCIALDIDIDPK